MRRADYDQAVEAARRWRRVRPLPPATGVGVPGARAPNHAHHQAALGLGPIDAGGLPISSLLRTVDLFVTHGGFNSVKESLSAGTPVVVIPLGGDQHYAAARCEALGVVVAVPASARTPSSIRAAALQVLGEARYRDRAADLRAEMQTLPDVGQAVGLLEGLGHRIARLPA